VVPCDVSHHLFGLGRLRMEFQKVVYTVQFTNRTGHMRSFSARRSP
jgi:hypothetical protein